MHQHSNICQNHRLEFERGACSEQELLDNFFADRRQFDSKSFLEVINSKYEWLPGMENLLEEVGTQGYDMHTLSNYPVSLFACQIGTTGSFTAYGPQPPKSVRIRLAWGCRECFLAKSSDHTDTRDLYRSGGRTSKRSARSLDTSRLYSPSFRPETPSIPVHHTTPP